MMMQDRFRVRGWSVYDSGYYDNIQNMLFGEEDDMTLLDAISKGLVNEIIPEQCTGIRDYLGKLIYEGDIIKNLRSKNNCYKVVAETNDYSFKFVGVNDDERISCFEKYAVIGNIHENPELLEDR